MVLVTTFSIFADLNIGSNTCGQPVQFVGAVTGGQLVKTVQHDHQQAGEFPTLKEVDEVVLQPPAVFRNRLVWLS